MESEDDFTADDFLLALDSQSRHETSTVAQKIFNALDVERKGKLGIDEVSAGIAILHKKIHDRFGFDLLNNNIDVQKHMEMLDEDEDGFITI